MLISVMGLSLPLDSFCSVAPKPPRTASLVPPSDHRSRAAAQASPSNPAALPHKIARACAGGSSAAAVLASGARSRSSNG